MTNVRVSLAGVLCAVFLASLAGCGDGGDNPVSSAPVNNGATGNSVVPTPPQISGTPASSVMAGSAYEFVPTVSASVGAALRFTIANQPAWAAFDATTGKLSGTPKDSDVGVYANVSIGASDGTSSVSLTPFSIKVEAATKQAITISGTPTATVVAGATYNFRPTTTAASGATLSFTVSKAPAWAKFDTATGTLSGTPAVSDVGTAAQIVISVSDGTNSAALAPFSITVTSGSSALATITWTMPPVGTGGATPTALSGYRVYYGTSAAGMTHVATIDDPTSTSYVIDNLSPGTWYFAVTSYDADKAESELSPTVAVAL